MPPNDSVPPEQIGIILVDHGSRRAESNDMLLGVVDLFRRHAPPGSDGGTVEQRHPIIEPAHMELAEPSIATAFDRCVQRGAKLVVVMPYFLLPGRHWSQDIPHLTRQAAAKHPGVRFIVGAPLGLHPLIAEVIHQRVEHCLAHARGERSECDVCAGTGRCVMREGSAPG